MCMIFLSLVVLSASRMPFLRRQQSKFSMQYEKKADSTLSMLETNELYVKSNIENEMNVFTITNPSASTYCQKEITDQTSVDIVIPFKQLNGDGAVSVILSDKQNDFSSKHEGTGFEITLNKTGKDKDEVTLFNFNTKEDRVDQMHSLTCKSLKRASGAVDLHIRYNWEYNTVSTVLYIANVMTRCSSENFIRIPKK
ncbi:hypothetical protein EIN_452740, partial [Entamoeba invadens IP1]